jgi:GST-like protein
MENDLILYYAPTPNGWKITILLEEANIDYKLVLINIAAGD